MLMPKVLQKTKQKLNKKKIFGFDIETYNKNKNFLLASLYCEEFQQTFYNKDTLIETLKQSMFKNSIIVATNLSFDFFGTFFGESEVKNFKFIFRGSHLIYAKTYLYNGKFNGSPSHKPDSITFLDTMNYAQMSVENLGKMLNIPKMKKPLCLGKKPKTKSERIYLERYNMQDSKISYNALKFFYKTFEELGATAKLTLASTAMSLYKNKFIKDNKYYLHDEDILIDLFKGYYGGRTEAFSRGKFKDYNYYDFNSLYASVMLNEFPDPNSLHVTKNNTLENIMNFEGLSDVEIFCPEMKYPLLPLRTDEKLLFPCGNFRGFHSHVELRKAIELGYIIKKVYKSYYYTKTCKPFTGYVNTLYNLRMKFKDDKSPMEKVVKILLNALYGKFGSKFLNKDNLIPFNEQTAEDLAKYDKFEFLGTDYIRVTENRPASSFCVPIWALYVTAYGRLKLYDGIIKSSPIYVDTDSLITRKKLQTSKLLGDLKLEYYVDEGIIIKPKFYAIKYSEKETIKIKGVALKLNWSEFLILMHRKRVSYKKFVKIREALRRNLIPNELIMITKTLSMNDNKRQWNCDFNHENLEHSVAVTV